MSTTTTPVTGPVAEGTGTGGRADDISVDHRTYHLEIFMISFSGLLLEIAYTRVISFKLFYYYTYLIIGLALLGVGFGGVLVAVSDRLRRLRTDTILLWGSLIGVAAVALGYFVVAITPINTLLLWDYGSRRSFSTLARLLVVCVALFAPFASIGVMVATLFGRRAERIGRLYFADLMGAGLACALAVFMIRYIGPPATIFLAGLVLAITAILVALRQGTRLLQGAAVVLGALMVIGLVAPNVLPDPHVDQSKSTISRNSAEYSRWSPIFRVDVQDVGNGSKLVYHDGLVGSRLSQWDGKMADLENFNDDIRSFPFAATGPDHSNVMIIGAAGGHEILTSLFYRSKHIDAIELNPVTHGMVTGKYADYTGHLADQPGVNYVLDDGRSYLERSDKKYNLVWYPAPDSYAAANAASSGAFVLSESYLYTKQAVKESLDHLRPGGILATQFGEVDYTNKPNRTARYASTVRKALGEMGIEDPASHMMVITTPSDLPPATISTILVKKDPFTSADVARITQQMGSVKGSQIRHEPGRPSDGGVVDQIITLPDNQLNAFYDGYKFDVRAISDNGPFFWHFARFKDVIRNFDQKTDSLDPESGTGERVLLLLFGIAILFALVFLLLPFVTIRKVWSALPRKASSAVYFAALGFGFIFFEITLIQKLTLFLGYPTYSLTVTLASILVFTGIGALLSDKLAPSTWRAALPLLGALVILTFAYLFGLPAATDALFQLPLAARVALAFVFLAPLGVCLGMFMPLGLTAVSRLTTHSREYVAWGWAVNGFASVVGSVLTTLLAMTFGFANVLLFALAAYLVAILALRGLLRPVSSGS
ncbi:MAG: hypothetical protein JO291_06265 [Acidimicrobiia bacterium]|nr:hypothetical protein [Acidimicrobiia bacterium]